jgi:transglutaminase-like putative cysteine protease
MKLRVGYELVYECPQPTPMLLMLNTHFSHAPQIIVADVLAVDPPVPIAQYRDGFGNLCSRLVAPQGRIALSTSALLEVSGEMERIPGSGEQHPVEELPDECLVFLLGSRYCETDRLSNIAWSLFGGTPLGWRRVQAICDYVHDRITFDYQSARPTKSAFEAYTEQRGVCRDYAHLAIAFCRCMNIPARYCTGYLGDIGVPVIGVMDFSAWFEAYLDGQWYVFDARNNIPRIGRVLIARGRDATDVPIANTFGPAALVGFTVVSEDLPA